MKNTLRTATLMTTTLVVTVLVTFPALATEGPREKSQIFTRSPHSMVGGFILLVCGLMVAAAVANAVQQLRGKRRQADGKFRWR